MKKNTKKITHCHRSRSELAWHPGLVAPGGAPRCHRKAGCVCTGSGTPPW